MNLDPYGYYSDEQIWTALEHAHLKASVKGLSFLILKGICLVMRNWNIKYCLH